MIRPIFWFGPAAKAVMVLAASAGTVAAQKCSDQPLRFYLYPAATLPDGVSTVTAAVTGDGNWYDASIKNCGGTYDAVLNLLAGSKRRLTFIFPSPIPSSYVDVPIPAGTYQKSGFINVRNLICKNCTDAHKPFTTHVGMQISSLINRRDFRLRYMPVIVDAPDLHIDPAEVPEENMPYSGSPALVIPQPYDCLSGGQVKPAWVVRGTVNNNDPSTPAGFQLQVGTAHDISSSTPVRAGQYSMPFEFRIEALQCFSY
ncbi:MAG: hypothetical protein HYX27_13110 [Acidobacteria bacterium]|nr:hypothetical protein [Acidobacteriota bacterium]